MSSLSHNKIWRHLPCSCSYFTCPACPVSTKSSEAFFLISRAQFSSTPNLYQCICRDAPTMLQKSANKAGLKQRKAEASRHGGKRGSGGVKQQKR